ncbi:MAG: trypsin-like serine protease, partial [Opitutales bacterium]|nr:trypsin-like serine protease [Opitutales bacterium]
MFFYSFNLLGRIACSFIAVLAIVFLSPHLLDGVVTSDGYGTHIMEPGELVNGINHDGVIQILRNGNFSCSGALLEGGRHVLTAGHCVSNQQGSITVRFELGSGFL